MNLEQISFSQRQRLAYIDFCLFFQGHLSRHELITHFEVGLSAATRDFNIYKEHCAHNLSYNNATKRYYQTKQFKPLFTHDARKTLVKLANKISDGFDAINDINFPVEAPSQLNIPDIHIVAKLTQAILNNKAVSVIYTSLSSGSMARELIPHSIVDNGLRWHARAFDRKSNAFRDFVLTRISKVTLLEKSPELFENKMEDNQWMRMMPLQLVPHPNNVKHPTAIELDYGMEKGQLEINIRAAMAGYLLRRWNVDCTDEATLSGGEYQLWLQNKQTLYGAENLAIAPGYKEEN
ncbi:MAG: WYL domain-containing protein [Colwellia sp.]